MKASEQSAGEATSSDFPTTKDAFQSQRRGFAAAFVATLSPDGQRLLHSTLLGGGGLGSKGRAIALDPHGAAYLTGGTGPGFPTKGGLRLSTRSPSPSYPSAFVAKLRP